MFARGNKADDILEAIRAKRTVVYGREGKAYGDAELIRLAAADGRLPARARPDYAPHGSIASASCSGSLVSQAHRVHRRW